MFKSYEKAEPNSCWNKALEGERVFILLERDPAATAAIRAWIGERLRLGHNQPNDPQLLEAESCARLMDHYRIPLLEHIEEQRALAKGVKK
jgi:hypothetical protein